MTGERLWVERRGSRGWIEVALLALCALSLLMATRDSAFLGDDLSLVEAGRHMVEECPLRPFTQRWLWSEIAEDWPPSAIDFYRPLVVTTFALDYLTWGLYPFGYLLTNALLHVACTLLLYHLARRLYPGECPQGPLICGAFFALNPGQMFNVLWISARTDTLCAVFYFSALICIVRASREKGSTYALLAALFTVLAIASKEMAYTLPIIAALLFLTLNPASEPLRDWVRRMAHVLSPTFVVSAVLLGLRFALIPLGSVGGGLGFDPIRYATTFARELRFLLLPFDVPLKASVLAYPLLSLLACLALVAVLYAVAPRLRSRFTLFPMVWLVVTLLPVLNVYNPWYLYIPSAGVALGAGWFFGGRIAGWRGWVVAAGVIGALCLYSLEINARAQVWTEAGRIVNVVAQDYARQTDGRAVRPVFLSIPGELGGIPVFNHNLNARLRLETGSLAVDASIAGYLSLPLDLSEHGITVEPLDEQTWIVRADSRESYFIFPAYPQDNFHREWGSFEIHEEDEDGLPVALKVHLNNTNRTKQPIFYYSQGHLLRAGESSPRRD